MNKVNYTYLRIPDKAWDVLAETLSMDTSSHSIEPRLRAQIARAFDKVEHIEVKDGQIAWNKKQVKEGVKGLAAHPLFMNLAQTICEVNEHWHGEKEKSEAFYYKYVNQVQGFFGIHDFKISLAVQIEWIIEQNGGWEVMTMLFDEVVSNVITFVFNQMEKEDDISKLEGDVYKWIVKLVMEDINGTK